MWCRIFALGCLVFGLCGRNAFPRDDQYTVDLIIFSYHRPMQLYALLESIQKRMQGLQDITVIYRSDTHRYEYAYAIVQDAFPDIHFVKQNKPPHDFKHLLRDAVHATKAPYIAFAVDDIVVMRPCNVKNCAELLELTGGYGFYLRLGKHTTYCYSEQRSVDVPPLLVDTAACLSWKFSQGKGDWGYPHSVDFTIYRTDDVKTFIDKLHFHSPNSFEGKWAAKKPLRPLGVAFPHAAVVNVPANLVQSDCPHNPHMGEQSAEDLLELFIEGRKIDIAPFGHLTPRSPHVPIALNFVTRERRR